MTIQEVSDVSAAVAATCGIIILLRCLITPIILGMLNR